MTNVSFEYTSTVDLTRKEVSFFAPNSQSYVARVKLGRLHGEDWFLDLVGHDVLKAEAQRLLDLKECSALADPASPAEVRYETVYAIRNNQGRFHKYSTTKTKGSTSFCLRVVRFGDQAFLLGPGVDGKVQKAPKKKRAPKAVSVWQHLDEE